MPQVLVSVVVAGAMTGVGLRRGRWAVSALAATLIAVVGLQVVAVPVTSDGVLTSSAQHPYGPPQWLPTRLPANIGCAKEACGPYEGHHYWALDLTGNLGDPLYAAGAGILHVGAVSPGCPPQGGPDGRDGTWVWIDHGGGVVTRYHHLDSIAVPDGTAVMPQTKIGTMGHSGDNQPCRSNYVHFEVRTGGVAGTRVDPGQLLGCTPGGVRSVPAALGADSWDDPAIHTRPRIRTPALTSDCVTSTWLDSPAAPRSVELSQGPGAVGVEWGPVPADVDTVVILLSGRRSDGTWGGPEYVAVPAEATGHEFTGLRNGRTYRVEVAYRNAAGTSLSASTEQTIPVDAPEAPRSPRYATWPARNFIHYGWHRPGDNGRPVVWFTVAWRCAVPEGSFGAWTTERQDVFDTYRNIGELEAFDRCEVKVRARNDVGASAWSATSTVTWPG